MAKQINAIVVENKMKNTITVNVLRSVVHPKYGKTLQRKTRFKVHTDGQDFKPGDKVLIEETRPYSKGVNFKIAGNVVEQKKEEVKVAVKKTVRKTKKV